VGIRRVISSVITRSSRRGYFAAKRRLADEYDAAQERGEVATRATTLKRGSDVPEENNGKPTAADLGISRKDIHEARIAPSCLGDGCKWPAIALCIYSQPIVK
jgi:hypothetical protein